MAPCYQNQTAAANIFQRERDARAAALPRLDDATPPERAAEIAGDEAFIQFRRGVLRNPGMTQAVIFNNNPAHFRNAEMAELKKLLAASGHVVTAEGQSPAEGSESAGYTQVMFVRPAPVAARPTSPTWPR